MASKRQRTQGASSSQGGRSKGSRATRNAPTGNIHGIEFQDTKQQNRYNALVGRKIVNTRYMDEGLLDMLGLRDDVFWMFERVGWMQCMSIKWPTYERITLEFLSSVEAEVLRGHNCEDGVINFRLFNTNHSMNLEQFNQLYGCPVGGARREPNQFNKHAFWAELTNQSSFDSKHAKSSNIRNPVFRYVQRVMAHTIFGRGDSDGVVRLTELIMMWAMMEGFHVDTGSYLVRQFTRVGYAAAGTIVIGGLITPIAMALGYELNGLKEATGNSRIDLESMLHMKYLSKVGDVFCHTLKDEGVSCPLPNPTRTTIRNKANWGFPVEMGQEDQLAIEYPSGVAHQGESSRSQPPPHAPYQEAQTTNEAGRAEFQDLRASVAELRAEQRAQHELMGAMDGRVQNMEMMLQAMYQWHLSQGHFPPPQ